ncbi:MAG: UvrD-helicase domain-containing protein [Bdellovibrionaceae bacterium]|nr:UvrD-helicase domain-containing protein [Pseudobdellovibrionaceae bacterium]
MFDILKSSLIKAGAGTGKTEKLTDSVEQLYQKFILNKKREPKLIVCTFTRKAAQELKERLFERAIKKIDNSSQENLQKTTSFLNYLQSSFIQISTIDKVLNRFLKKYSRFIDLNPDFEISDTFYDKELFDSLAEEFIYDKYFSLLQKFPYPVLREIFLSYFENYLKHGKIAFYDEKDFIDFKKEKNKYDFDNSLALSVKKALSLSDDNKIKKIFQEEDKFNPDNFIPVFKDLQKAGEEYFFKFLDQKKSSSILTTNDLLLFSYDLLKKHFWIAKDFSKNWDYWFIDEYQDTSWIQEQIIEKITQFKNVTCVGDPAQSIYSFRGADPDVFNRREKETEKIERLETNYRSSDELIAFYNDFFKKNNFIKFKAPKDNKTQSFVKPYLSFFTYDKQDKESYQYTVFQTLYNYIEKLKSQGVAYSEIAILSFKNEDMSLTADYLRNKKLPVVLHGSNNRISQSRLVLDSLFLLKFLINPYDDVNLKALLRTPYFRLLDQDLADDSFEYNALNKEAVSSFWSFIKEKHKKSVFVKKLKIYLENYKKYGLFESFTQALFDSAIMDLSYWQDPTSAGISNLWKLIDLLKDKNSSELKLFYDLLEDEGENKDYLKSAPLCDEASSISLMTVHKSKGLQFPNVILLDFSMDRSSLHGQNIENNVIFDRSRNKMTAVVPIGGREKTKVKCFGHEIYKNSKDQIKVSEKERLYYVAMTRAKNSLALFIPHNKEPRKNSWLKGLDYFYRISGLLEHKASSKIWKLNSGIYSQKGYSLIVENCETINQDPQSYIQSDFTDSFPADKNSSFLTKDLSQSNSKASCNFITSNYKSFKKTVKINSFSSKDFIKFLDRSKDQKNNISFSMTKNVLLKSCLGVQLHFFLQKLFYTSIEKLDFLIHSNPSLSKKNQEKIKKALIYIKELKDPNISSFFKTGYSEWSFKFKKQNIILKGQIDLWSWSDKDIYLFDYKSAVSKSVKNQLIFYAWILNQMYQPRAIWMHECYPLEEQIKKMKYSDQHEELFNNWFKTLN